MVDPDDLSQFIGWYFTENPTESGSFQADYNGNGGHDPEDLADYIAAFFAWDQNNAPAQARPTLAMDHGALSRPGVENRLGYCGYVWDRWLQIYHVRHRVYEPYHGRWYQPDPIGFAGGRNWFEYCGGSPGMYSDPWGLQTVTFVEQWEEGGRVRSRRGDMLDWGVNFSAGMADGVSFGLTNSLRGALGWNDAVDTRAGEYRVGAVIGIGITLVITGGGAGAGAVIAGGVQGAAIAGGFSALGGNGVMLNATAAGFAGGAAGAWVGGFVGGGAFVGGAIAGAAGDAASQGVQILTGERDQFSFTEMGAAAVLGGGFNKAAPWLRDKLGGACTGAGGRLGNDTTRRQIAKIARELERRGWRITGGGGRFKEEYLRPLNGGRKGGSYLDITAEKGTRVLRINTIDTLTDGLTPTAREWRNALRIRLQRPSDHLLLIPKPR